VADARLHHKILLVEDSPSLATVYQEYLRAGPYDIRHAHCIADALKFADQAMPDGVLLDLRLPDGTGFDACRQILRRLPETRVLMLTSVADDTLVDEAIRAGAHGYLLKEVNSRALIQAITDVAAGKSILDPAVTARVMQFMKAGGPTRDVLASLSPQESRVLALIAQGKTNKEAGNEMNLTEKTVKNYLSNIFEKLHVSRRAQAAAIYAQRQP
jgi:two-component system response regulator DevR